MSKNKFMAIQIILSILYVAMLVFFAYECFKNGEDASKQASGVANVVANVQEAITKKPVVVDDNYRLAISKGIGHYGYFCLLGLVSVLFYMTFKKLKIGFRVLLHFTSGIVFAFLTEFVAEALTSGRNASFTDVLIDTAGLFTFSSIFLLIFFIYKYIKGVKKV